MGEEATGTRGRSRKSGSSADASSSPKDDDDLTDVVRRQKHRLDERITAKRANDRYTRAFLEAGMRLIEADLTSSEPRNERDDFGSLPGLHRKNVIAEALREDSHNTAGRFRDRWEFMPDYISDLIRYALRSARWSPHYSLVEHYQERVSGASLPDLAQEVAYRDLDLIRQNSAAMRFQLITAAFAAKDPNTAEALGTAYSAILSKWQTFYREVLDKNDLRLRPGVDVADITSILHAAMEGFSLRLIGDPTAPVVDDSTQSSLLGTLASAIIVACIDWGSDQRSMEEFAAGLKEVAE